MRYILSRSTTGTIGEVDLFHGDIPYWPPGKNICIFFGLTPSSKGSEIRAYSPVGVLDR